MIISDIYLTDFCPICNNRLQNLFQADFYDCSKMHYSYNTINGYLKIHIGENIMFVLHSPIINPAGATFFKESIVFKQHRKEYDFAIILNTITNSKDFPDLIKRLLQLYNSPFA